MEGNLLNNELVFLKYIHNKETDITFSSRWEFQHNLNPKLETDKLLKLEYITVNQAKYRLTSKGEKILDKNKKLFMSDRERAGKDYQDLTETEYTQLKVFHKINEYKKLKNNELSFEKGYTKNDILWHIYDQQKDTYIQRKDYIMASVVYNRMYELLKKEKRFQKALDCIICCLYLRVYDNNDYERHLKKFMKDLNVILKKNGIDIDNFNTRYEFIIKDIKVQIKLYLPYLYNDEKINIFQQKINEFLDT